MHELGLLEEFLKLPHRRIAHFAGTFGGTPAQFANLTHLARARRDIVKSSGERPVPRQCGGRVSAPP
jgi:hypothetical protein